MHCVLLRCFGLTPTPSRDFVPAADSLSCARKKVSKESAPAKPPACCAAGCPAMLEAQGSRGTHFATLRSNNCAKSVVEARCARALGFCASRRFRRGGPETAEQPTAKPESRAVDVFLYAPFSPAEQRKALKPRAKLASRTDSAQLFDRSVAKGVLRGASRPEQRREPEAQHRAGRPGGALWLLSGGPESNSPPGAKSRHDTWQKPSAARSI